MRLLGLVCLCFAGSLLANPGSMFAGASPFESDDIVNVVEEVATPSDFLDAMEEAELKTSPTDNAAVTIANVINIGEKVWTIIEKNKPVVDIRYTYANALPEGVKSSRELERFSDLQARSFRTYGKNWFNATVYDVTYTVIHRYNGSYQGRGRYLENVTILPSNVSALWGYKVNMDVGNVSTVNVGTAADPVASILMEMNFGVSTVIKSHHRRSVYQFRGDSPTAVIH